MTRHAPAPPPVRWPAVSHRGAGRSRPRHRHCLSSRRSRAGPGAHGRRTTRWLHRPPTATAPAISPRHSRRPAHGSSKARSAPGPHRIVRRPDRRMRRADARSCPAPPASAVANKPQERVRRRAAGLVRQAQCACRRYRHHIRIGDRRKIHIPDAVGEFARHLARDLYGEARLAYPAGSGQGDKPVVRQQLAHLGSAVTHGPQSWSAATENYARKHFSPCATAGIRCADRDGTVAPPVPDGAHHAARESPDRSATRRRAARQRPTPRRPR